MKKILLLIGCLCISDMIVNAQSKSTVDIFGPTHGKIVHLGNQLLWESYHFTNNELFQSTQSINILRTKLKNRRVKFALGSADNDMKLGDTTRKLIETNLIASRSNALAAINGGFFNTKRGGSVDFIQIEGKILDTTNYDTKRVLPDHSRSAIVIHKNKVAIIPGDTIPSWEKKLTADNVLVTGPLLLWHGTETSLKNNAFTNNRHPRTCACITNEKELLLITVDGRNSQAHGMSLHELTNLTKRLGCYDAINLDGGGSTTMYIKGQSDEGIVNYPSDNKVFDHLGVRKVSNIFMILLK